MNENINLCEILKDCPRETALYSPMYGNVYFSHIDLDAHDSEESIVYMYRYKLLEGCTRCDYSQEKDKVAFYSDGTTGNPDFNVTAECMLFPSKDQRDWSKWKCPKPKKPKFNPKTLKAFDKVLVRASNLGCHCWYGDFVNLQSQGNKLPCVLSDKDYKMIIPYNDDTKHLIGTTDKAPANYRYWED